MIKIRNHRRVALLLVLAMLATMFVGVGTSAAATYTNYNDIDSSWTYVDADETGAAGTVYVDYNSKLPSQIATSTPVDVEVKITTEDVTFDSNGSTKQVFQDCTLPADGELALGDINVGADVTGDIQADVHVYAFDGSAYLINQTETVTIAKVDAGDVTIDASKAKTVRVGDDQVAAPITVSETDGSKFADTQKVTYSIVTDGVEFYDWAFTDQSSSLGIDSHYDSDTRIEATFYGTSDPDEYAEFTPYLTVLPSCDSDTIDIRVNVNGVLTQTVTVAKLGSYDTAISVKNADKDSIYRGQYATLDDVNVKIDPAVDWDDCGYFTITLPEGVTFANGTSSIATNTSDVYCRKIYNDDQTAWFAVNFDTDNPDTTTLNLTDWDLAADADAVVGDLNVTFGGDLEGTYKIGSIKNAFTVETTPFALQAGKTTVAGPNIVIKETADGALQDDYGWFDIELPAGIDFAETPDIDVTSGDAEIDGTGIHDWYIDDDNDTLRFYVEETSTEASTITISNLVYEVYNQPMLGDVVAKVGSEYNQVSDKVLEKVTVGAIATNPTAVYVIGASTFTVNGATQNVVTPSYIKNGRTYLAIRDIATGLGIDPVNVLWDAAAQKVTLVKGDKIVQVTIGSTTMYVNGVAIAMDVAPEISNGRTTLPAAFIAQAFGATASWDAATQTVTIK